MKRTYTIGDTTMYRKFDHRDYQANPGKYRLFSTAVFATNIRDHNDDVDIPAGTIAGIKFRCDAYNALTKRIEPVYSVNNRDFYANAFGDFVL